MSIIVSSSPIRARVRVRNSPRVRVRNPSRVRVRNPSRVRVPIKDDAFSACMCACVHVTGLATPPQGLGIPPKTRNPAMEWDPRHCLGLFRAN